MVREAEGAYELGWHDPGKRADVRLGGEGQQLTASCRSASTAISGSLGRLRADVPEADGPLE